MKSPSAGQGSGQARWCVCALLLLLGGAALGPHWARAAATRSDDAPATSATGQPDTARAEAPFDLTGWWVSVVTQDWRFRMVVPGKGEYGGIPINLAAKRFADAWDPAGDEASGQQCKAYGAGGLMHIPGRLHITWRDAHTLQVQTDAGLQTRLLHFDSGDPPPAGIAPSLQGRSLARWVFPRRGGDPAVRGAGVVRSIATTKYGTLEVVTDHVIPGYLRKNGIPYSERMRMLEYWDEHRADDGTVWLVIPTELDDPTYLQSAWDTVPIFKREADGSRWHPTPCSLRW